MKYCKYCNKDTKNIEKKPENNILEFYCSECNNLKADYSYKYAKARLGLWISIPQRKTVYSFCENCNGNTISVWDLDEKTQKSTDIEYCAVCDQYKPAAHDYNIAHPIQSNNTKPKPIPQPEPEPEYHYSGVECPYCHSHNTKKISGFTKGAAAALFGVFAVGKVSKQWHCNNCDSDF